MASSSQSKRSAPPPILDGTYFKPVTENNGLVDAECVTCTKTTGKSVIVKGKLQTTSNYLTHLQRHHIKDGIYEKCKSYITSPTALNKRGRQKSLTETYKLEVKLTPKAKADSLLIDYVVNTMAPLSIVDDPYFKKLLKEFPQNVDAPSRNTLVTRIDTKFNDMISKLKAALQAAKWLCCTADCWKSKSGNKSYLGVTCHWLDDNFDRVSVVLAIRRFKGSHTYDAIAELLTEIFRSFDIAMEKLVCVVTDNGSNFVKAFQEYGIDFANSDISSDNSSDEEGEDVLHIEEFQEGSSEASSEIVLPKHVRCASHTLNLVASVDSLEVTNQVGAGRSELKSSYKSTFRDVMAKCSAFWNKYSRSPQVAEKVLEITKKAIVKPNSTRWNSLYDSIKRLLEFKDHLPAIFDIAGVTRLKQTDIDFLDDYQSVMSPVAKALDKLQGEKRVNYGSLAPVITELRTKLDVLAQSGKKYVVPIANAMKAGLERRFDHILSLDFESCPEAFIAAMTTPFFKLRWLPQEKRSAFKEKFVEEAKKWASPEQEVLQKSPVVIDDDFFVFESEDPESGSGGESIQMECIRFFADKSVELGSLEGYPTIKKMFHRFNTPLPSSAPVERLFSYGGMILRPHRAKMSDGLFEQLILLKLNSKLGVKDYKVGEDRNE